MEGLSLETVNAVLDELVQQARTSFDKNLRSIVLFGSAAEDRLRQLSDVNLMLLLDRFDPSQVDSFRATLRVSHSAIGAKVMFLVRDELAHAARLFAVKFNDIKLRHRILYGEDPMVGLTIDADALRNGLRELLLDVSIRMRERYALLSLREEQLVPIIADVAAPLRAAAFALLQLKGHAAGITPREALDQVAFASGKAEFVSAAAALPVARETMSLPVGQAGPALLNLSALATFLFSELNNPAGGA